jgi:uncharacterized protein (TIGR02466 family)
MNPSDLSSAQLAWLFPSPVMHHDWPESSAINAGLRAVIAEKRRTTLGVVKTNRGGWQSDTDLQTWDDEAVRTLLARIQQLAREYVARQFGDDERFASGWTVRGWANVNGPGNFNRAHDHLGAQSSISGIYYVDVGDIESGAVSGGRTRFEDWTWTAVSIAKQADPLQRDAFMAPRNDRMVLFPASLMHSVEAYQGADQRVTIAFNLHHPLLAVPRLQERLARNDWWWTNFRGLMLLRDKLPEKFYALALLPGQLLGRAVQGRSFSARLRLAWAHATALASERFEKR